MSASLFKTESLFWVPPQHTDVGVMPGFYMRATTEEERQALIAMGARDVSDDPEAWKTDTREFHESALHSA